MSKPENEAMEKYITDSLAGLIWPSSSLEGWDFSLWTKKKTSHSSIDYRRLNELSRTNTLSFQVSLPLLLFTRLPFYQTKSSNRLPFWSLKCACCIPNSDSQGSLDLDQNETRSRIFCSNLVHCQCFPLTLIGDSLVLQEYSKWPTKHEDCTGGGERGTAEICSYAKKCCHT